MKSISLHASDEILDVWRACEVVDAKISIGLASLFSMSLGKLMIFLREAMPKKSWIELSSKIYWGGCHHCSGLLPWSVELSSRLWNNPWLFVLNFPASARNEDKGMNRYICWMNDLPEKCYWYKWLGSCESQLMMDQSGKKNAWSFYIIIQADGITHERLVSRLVPWLIHLDQEVLITQKASQ